MAFEEPGEVEGGDAAAFVELFAFSVFVLEIDVAFAGGIWATCGEGGVGTGAWGDEALDGPGFSGIETAPDGEFLAFVAVVVGVAVEEDVAALDGEANEAGVHAEVSVVIGTSAFLASVSWTVGESFEKGGVFPGLAAVFAESVVALVAEFLTFGKEAASGSVEELAVGEFEEVAFAAALNGDRLAGEPGLAVVITVNGGAVAFGGFSINSGGTDESALVLAMSKGDTVFGHVKGRNVAVGIFGELGVYFFPGFALVLTAEE